MRAERIVVRQDAEGFQLATATGNAGALPPDARIRSRRREGRRLDGRRGAAHRDRRPQARRSSCSTTARVNRGGDEVAGNYIFVDQRSDFFTRSRPGKGGEEPAGASTAVIQPKPPARNDARWPANVIGAIQLLRSQSLRKRYKSRTVVQDVSLEVASGEVVGLLGPNGAGKTTCFYMIVGLVPVDAGAIHLDGERAHAPADPPRARAWASPTCRRRPRSSAS